MNAFRRILLVLLVAAACPLFSSCSTVDAVSGQKVYNLYTMQEDIDLGQKAMASNLDELKKEHVRTNIDQAHLAKIREITARITAVSDMPQLPYEVTLIQTNIVNAAAMPGGQMIVFEGLYDPKVGLVQDDNEMAAVIAHEIAHVNCRHTTERLSKIMTAAMVAEVAAVVAENNDRAQVADAIRAAFAVGTALWIPTYSRADEAEADRIGMFYMAKAGFDPRAAPRIWKRVNEREKKQGGDGGMAWAMSIFATHPSNEARYRELSKLLPYAMEEYKKATGSYPPDYNPAQYQAVVQKPLDWRNPKPK